MEREYNLLRSYRFSASHRHKTGLNPHFGRCVPVLLRGLAAFRRLFVPFRGEINRSWFLYGDRDLQRSLLSSVSVDFQPVTDEMRRKHSEKEPKRNAEKEDRRCKVDIRICISIH